MDSTTREATRKLMLKYNIHFDGPISSADSATWPETCRDILRDIRDLGGRNYEQYQLSISPDLRSRYPWREHMKGRAHRIVGLAKRCLDGRKNEAGWRLSVEPEVMLRLVGEVNCWRCRGRLWRSELESEPKDKEVADALLKRRIERTVCTCDPTCSRNDIQDYGLNRLFDDRVDEAIVYPPEIKSQLPRKRDRPDRVYGLQRRSRLDHLLSSPDIRTGETLEDILKCSPFRSDGEPLIFPFLVLEAKSEKGASSFSDIEVQSAFAIRELLIIQNELRQAANEGADWDGGPFVWFVSYKGEQWRVHAATTEHIGDAVHYRVRQVWSGGINSFDNALQLLLIMDYIVDWARDRYREAIIQSLRQLAATDSRSLAHDTDIPSRMGFINEWTMREGLEDSTTPESEDQTEPTDPLRALDSRYGVIRDTRFIRSQHIGLYITEDNFNVLMDSWPETQKKQVASGLADALVGAWRVEQQALDLLEYTWTGKDREGTDTHKPDEIFLVATTVSAYITPGDWEQTRELSYLAVAESLLDRILRHTTLDRRSWATDMFPFVEAHSFNAQFRSFLMHKARDNFKACISRACVVSGTKPANRDSTDSDKARHAVCAEPAQAPSQGLHQVAALLPGSETTVRDLVHKVYKKYEVGRNPPTSPIFRLSSVVDELGPALRVRNRPEVLQRPLWPRNIDHKAFDYHDIVFAQGEELHDPCLFVMDAPGLQDGSEFGDKLLRYKQSRHLEVETSTISLKWGRRCNVEIRDVSRQNFHRNIIKRFIAHLRGEPLDTVPGFDSRAKSTQRAPKGIFEGGWKWDVLTAGRIKPHDVHKFPFAEGLPHRRRPRPLTRTPWPAVELNADAALGGKGKSVATEAPGFPSTVDTVALGSHSSAPLVIDDDEMAPSRAGMAQASQIQGGKAGPGVSLATSIRSDEGTSASHSSPRINPVVPTNRSPHTAKLDIAQDKPAFPTDENNSQVETQTTSTQHKTSLLELAPKGLQTPTRTRSGPREKDTPGTKTPSSKRLRESARRALQTPTRKRSVPQEEDIPEAESSSSAERRKRQRTVADQSQFTDDCLDDDALEKLIKEGMFS